MSTLKIKSKSCYYCRDYSQQGSSHCMRKNCLKKGIIPTTLNQSFTVHATSCLIVSKENETQKVSSNIH